MAASAGGPAGAADVQDAELQAIRHRLRAQLEADIGARDAAGPPTAGMPQGVVVSGDTDLDAVLERAPLAFVDLWAPWCGPCRAFAPVFEAAATEFAGQAAFIKVNVDENPATPQRFGVRSIPTLAVVQGGRVIHLQPGAMPLPMFRSFVQRFVSGR